MTDKHSSLSGLEYVFDVFNRVIWYFSWSNFFLFFSGPKIFLLFFLQAQIFIWFVSGSKEKILRANLCYQKGTMYWRIRHAITMVEENYYSTLHIPCVTHFWHTLSDTFSLSDTHFQRKWKFSRLKPFFLVNYGRFPICFFKKSINSWIGFICT